MIRLSLNSLIASVITSAFSLQVLLGVGFMPAPAAFAENAGYNFSSVSSAKGNQIQSVYLDPGTKTLHVTGLGQGLGSNISYSVLKLPDPYRLIIDIPDAEIGIRSNQVPIQQHGVEKVVLEQQNGTFYKAVRLTVYVKDSGTLQKLQTSFGKQGLQVSLSGAPSSEVSVQPSVANRNETPSFLSNSAPIAPASNNVNRAQINNVYFRDGQLMLKAAKAGQDKLRVKNRIVLSAPSRLVLDIENAAVSSKSLLGSIPVQGMSTAGLIKQLRVGQFDENTVRIVIETNEPDQFTAYYPELEQSTLAIGPATLADIATLPKGTPLGNLERINIDNENGSTVIRLTASSPLIHRMSKQGDKINVDLLNVAARTGLVNFDSKQFNAIQGMHVDPLVSGQPNSKFVIDLANNRWEVDTRLSANKQTLELILTPPVMVSGSKTQAPFNARVVVDAGHGGKDHGAIRQGILEKDLNLKVALKLKKALEARGAKVIMTRDTDEFLPLPTISAIANRHQPDVFVSVHHNASTNPSLNGIETYFYTAHSRPLADKIHHQMVNAISSPDRGVRKAMFYVIHHTTVPAVLCEVGYVSNSKELQELNGESRQEAAAQAIAEGVVRYLQSKVSANAR